MKTSDFIKREWVFWMLIIAPTIFAIYYWPVLPDKIPIHWNASGEVDNYGGKWAAFLSPLIGLALYFLMIFIPKIDPRKKNYDLFSGTYWIIRLSLGALMAILGFITILAAMGSSINVGLIVMVSVFSLFLIMGNQFGKIRPNYFVGIRTPWTINNDEVWVKTHRLAGRIWVIASAGMMVCVFLVPLSAMAYLFIPYLFLLAAVPIFYSFIIHKKIIQEKNG